MFLNCSVAVYCWSWMLKREILGHFLFDTFLVSYCIQRILDIVLCSHLLFLSYFYRTWEYVFTQEFQIKIKGHSWASIFTSSSTESSSTEERGPGNKRQEGLFKINDLCQVWWLYAEMQRKDIAITVRKN